MAQTQPSAAYIPRHAARDSARTNIAPRLGSNSPLPQQLALQSSRGGPLSTRLTSFERMSESTDFKNFVAAHQKAEIRTTQDESTTKTPGASRVMDELIADYDARRRSLASQRSTGTRRSSGRSFMDKVADYYKPSRWDSVYSLNPVHTTAFRDNGSIMQDISEDGQEKGPNRWSRIAGSTRWSFSRNWDMEGDERAGRTSRDGSVGMKRRIVLCQ